MITREFINKIQDLLDKHYELDNCIYIEWLNTKAYFCIHKINEKDYSEIRISREFDNEEDVINYIFYTFDIKMI